MECVNFACSVALIALKNNNLWTFIAIVSFVSNLFNKGVFWNVSIKYFFENESYKRRHSVLSVGHLTANNIGDDAGK